MKRKAISVLLAAMMVTTLAVGCGNKGGGKGERRLFRAAESARAAGKRYILLRYFGGDE